MKETIILHSQVITPKRELDLIKEEIQQQNALLEELNKQRGQQQTLAPTQQKQYKQVFQKAELLANILKKLEGHNVNLEYLKELIKTKN